MRRLIALALLAASLACRPRVARPVGFSIEPATSAPLGALAGFAFDSRGRPLVFRERGFPVLLSDNNGDGLFDTERVVTTWVSGVRGACFDGRMLYLLGTGPGGQYGLYRVEDRGGVPEAEPETLASFPPPGPGLHDIRRGPDGTLTLLQGERWLRWNEERRALTVLASGFANPRAHVHDRDGEALVIDAGARLIHAVPGGDYSAPSYHFDVLPPIREAPVSALAFYHHNVYPEPFRDLLFLAEGDRLAAGRLVRNGATYSLTEFTAAQLAPAGMGAITALEVGPDGFIYFSASGPKRGGLYRARYTPGLRERWERWRTPPPAHGVAQPQPLSAWGHAALQREHDLLEARWGEELEVLARDAKAPAAARTQAVLLLHRFGPRPKPALLKSLLADPEPRVRAVATFAGGGALATPGLADSDPLVRRRAAEAVDAEFSERLYSLLADSDRFVRYAARLALERAPREEWRARALAEANPPVALEALLALTNAGGDRGEILERLLELPPAAPGVARLFALASAGVRDAALARRAAEKFLPLFPAPDRDEAQNRDVAAALAWCGGAEAIDKLLDALPRAASNQPLQLHYAQCLRSIKDGWSPAQKETMLVWTAKAAPQLFPAFLASVLTREEQRRARQRFPNVASPAAASTTTADEIFEAQFSPAEPPVATPGQGRALFEKRCASCHNGNGPDLAEAARRLDKRALLEAILWPARNVAERYASVELALEDGSTIEGLVVREDAKGLLVRTAAEPRPISILKRRVKTRRQTEKTIMPEGLLDGESPGAVADLLEWLSVAGK